MTGALKMASQAAASARQWWPADWADEVMPPGLTSPDAFIHPLPLDDRMSFMLCYEDGEAEADNEFYRLAVSPGEIVPFICCDPLGEIEVEIRPAGTYAALGEVPANATHFCIGGDPDTLAHTLKDFVDQFVANAPSRDPADGDLPARVEISMAWWSDALPHKLVVEDGKACFIAVSAAEARQ